MQGAKRKSTHGWMLLLGVGDGIALVYHLELRGDVLYDIDVADARLIPRATASVIAFNEEYLSMLIGNERHHSIDRRLSDRSRNDDVPITIIGLYSVID